MPRMTRRRFLGAAVAGACLARVRPAFARLGRPLVIAHTDKASVYWRETAAGYRGLDAEVIAEVLVNRLKLDVAYLVQPSRRVEQALKGDEADAILTLVNPQRLAYAAFTRTPMLSSGRAIVYRKDHPRRAALEAATDLGSLLPFVYCYNAGGMTDRDRAARFAQSTSAGSDAQVLVMLQHGRGDFTIESITGLRQELDRAGLGDDLTYRLVPGLGTVDRHFGIRTSLPEHAALLAEIDVATQAAWADGSIPRLIKGAETL